MKQFEPFDDELEIFSFGKNIQIKSNNPIACCWIMVGNPIGKIVFKRIEKDLTEITIGLKVKSGVYFVTLVTENRFASKMVFLR
jgi:hypothetical protein